MDDFSTKNELTIAALRVHTVPAVINGNFAELNTWLDKLLQDQITLVTPETLAEEKRVIANLRKLAKEIDSKAKEVVAIVSGDVAGFTDNMKLLKAKVTNVVDAKDEQVKALENATKDKCRALLTDLLAEEYALHQVSCEFRTHTIESWVKLTALTAKGELTKAARDGVVALVKDGLANQARINSRLNELELRCLKADINPPLSRASIEPFLFADDAVFYARFDALLNAEIDRKTEAEQRMINRLMAENQRKLDAALAEQLAEATRIAQAQAQKALAATPVTPAPHPLPEPDPTPLPENSAYYSLIVTYKATKTITFASQPHVPHDKIKARFMGDAKLLEGVDPHDVISIEVVEK